MSDKSDRKAPKDLNLEVESTPITEVEAHAPVAPTKVADTDVVTGKIFNKLSQTLNLNLPDHSGRYIGIEIPAKGFIIWPTPPNGDLGPDFAAKARKGYVYSAY